MQTAETLPPLVRPVSIPRYRYPLPKPYNGFTGLERARSWQLTRWAISAGVMEPPKVCSICEVPKHSMQYHAEDYYAPLDPHPICKSCHMRLHLRFRNPDAWVQLVAKFGGMEAWFEDLKLDRIDLAGELRDRYGDAITDVRVNVIETLGPGAPRPVGKLYLE